VWTDLVRVASRFSSAVLTFRDAEGYPFSVRCHPQADDATESFQLEIPVNVPVCAGPASLLWHLHDERLWNQVSYSTRGQLEQVGTYWRYTPTRYTPGVGIGGVTAFVRFVFGARRTAAGYLTRRGLARPRVPWQQIDAIKSRALRH
jgi:hypothetical protein